ncbi:MAG: hypothetical protein ACREJ4_15295 [Candidatus Methylomirabilaceae bacterium]
MRPNLIGGRLLVAAAALLLGQAPAAAQVSHYETRLPPSRQPTTNAVLDGRIQQAAAQYRAYAPVPRVAFYDIAYPADSAEYLAMHGYALLIVTAIDQDSTELPPIRVYLRAASETLNLPLVAIRTSLVADPTIRGTFGLHRVDGLYLLPVAARRQPGDLLLDFARNRQGFRLGQLDQPLPVSVQTFVALRTGTDLPPLTKVSEVARREYPDLATMLQLP